MSLETFNHAVNFASMWNIIAVSGGEPTESPYFGTMCYSLDALQLPFTITSNGTWCFNNAQVVQDVLNLPNCLGMQVYSNPKWYRHYKEVTTSKYMIHPKITLVTTDIMSMQDLGRAKLSEKAQIEVKNNKHAPSCLKLALLLRQVDSYATFSKLNTLLMTTRPSASVMCTPMVDWQGNVHVSESWHCPSCGNVVKDDLTTIWQNLKAFKPCMQCALAKQFFSKSDLRTSMIKKQLDL